MKESEFLGKLYSWHDSIERYLPWKENADGYQVWVSEIILQQTRVEQGTPYYLRFMQKWPTVSALAAASEDEILKIWEGLGYYSRARNMHAAAKQIVDLHNGQFPKNYEEILALKGIGPYTAAAISSFAFGGKHAVMDGNVMRVITRIYGIDSPIDKPTGRKAIQKEIDRLIDEKNPGRFNQAMMDFGALACKSANPLCQSCNFNEVCIAFKANLVSQLPVKAGKITKKTRYFHYLWLQKGDQIAIKRREKGDIWEGLYELPLIENLNSSLQIEEVIQFFKNMNDAVGDQYFINHSSKLDRHVLTHLYLEATIYKIEGNFELFTNNTPYFFVPIENLDNFAFPKLLLRFLTANGHINR
ncbi:MAG TPA: A/G-specific adenine glycosylase [Saprospiraceae bacterium]|nr:A/G-specific adenine glycosylase [Saprospiraceae bacterium]